MSAARELLTDAYETSLQALQSPEQWWQVLILALAGLVAWLIARLLRKKIAEHVADESSSAALARAELANRITLPTVLGLLCLLAAGVFRGSDFPHGMLFVAGELALALVAIQLLAAAMKRIIKPGPLLVTFDHIIPWIVWFAVAMHLLGWTEPLAGVLDSIGIPLGKSRVSLLDLLKAAVTLLLFTIGAAYLSQLASRRIMAIGDIGIGLRVGITKFVKLVLYVLAGVLALDAVGVNLGALTVFGGALGIGLGFGLQRITANFVSGFIIIADRSIRQGDVITIGERLGVVRELRARYIVVQDRDGVDTLIPNENVISSEVINWSYADSAIRLKLPIQISYADNPRQALAILDKAADNHPRVQKTPAPASRLMSFGDNGIDLELRFWIRDPQDGVNNVRSDLYLDIWDMFQDAGITIPFPQRDLHLPRDWPRTAISEEPH